MEYQKLNDEELAELSKKDDQFAFREIMERYGSPIHRFVSQYAKNKEDALDISQDVFFKVWRKIRSFHKGKKFKPWLYAISRNTSLDFLKKKKAMPFSSLDDEENGLTFADTLEDGEPLQDKVFANNEISTIIDVAMKHLHPEHGAIIIMHYKEGMTFEEIAEVIGKPMNTVKSWHHRSLKKLRKHISHQSVA